MEHNVVKRLLCVCKGACFIIAIMKEQARLQEVVILDDLQTCTLRYVLPPYSSAVPEQNISIGARIFTGNQDGSQNLGVGSFKQKLASQNIFLIKKTLLHAPSILRENAVYYSRDQMLVSWSRGWDLASNCLQQ